MTNKIWIALVVASSSLAFAAQPVISPFFTFVSTPFGDGPNGPLVLASDGNFYGTTADGGDDGQGCFTNQSNCAGAVFKITPQGQFTLLHTFKNTDPTNGEAPSAGLVEGPDGFLYGTTSSHGFSLQAGTIFKIAKDGNQFQTIYQFCSASGCPVGSVPTSALTLASDGNFYGTTSSGPGLATGAVFRMTPDGVVSLLALFDGHNNVTGIPGTNASLQGLVQASDGNLYGVTDVNIFRLTLGGAVSIVHTFDPGSEGFGSASLVQANDGNLYGMTDTPNVFTGGGVLFRVGLDGAYQTLAALNGSAIGFHPQALIQASDGNLWGITTNTTSANAGGCVFSVTLSGTLLQSTFLTPATGTLPTGALTQGRDGRLFGAAALGGVNSRGNSIDAGTIFVVDAGLPALLQSIVITGPNSTLVSGASEQFTATGTYGDGSVVTLTSLVKWSSSNPDVASISSTGFATANNLGPTNISASLAGVTSNLFPVTVVAPAAPVITAFRVLFGSQSYLVTGTSRTQLPWQIDGIQITFSQAITSGTKASLGGISATGLTGIGSNTLTWSFAPLAIADVTVTLAGSGSNALKNTAGVGLGSGAGASQKLKILWGDFTDDGAVSATDLVGVNNARVGAYNIFADTNGDGAVDATDVQAVRSRIGTILP